MARYEKEIIRPVWVEVDLEAIRENIRQIRRLTGQGAKAPEIMAVVKAEAYGHGAAATARAAADPQPPDAPSPGKSRQAIPLRPRRGQPGGLCSPHPA